MKEPHANSITPARGFFGCLLATLSMIKVAHSIFALPFALLGFAIGWTSLHEADAYLQSIDPGAQSLFPFIVPNWMRESGEFGAWFAQHPWLWTLIWVIAAAVSARSFAMTFNRIVDRHWDARNPRTARRELATGQLSLRFAWGFALASAAVFCLACLMLNTRCLVLAPVVLLVVGGYSLTKRFTAACHLVLGVGLGLAPIGAWLAVTGGPVNAMLGGYAPFGSEIFGSTLVAGDVLARSMPGSVAFASAASLFGLGVMFWVAGFDIIYALQDDEFDRSQGLHSIPALFGRAKALLISRLLHVASIIAWCGALAWLGGHGHRSVLVSLWHDPTGHSFIYDQLHGVPAAFDIGPLSWIALALAAVGLVWEQRLVKADDLSRVNAAFFTLNGIISIVTAGIIMFDLLLV